MRLKPKSHFSLIRLELFTRLMRLGVSLTRIHQIESMLKKHPDGVVAVLDCPNNELQCGVFDPRIPWLQVLDRARQPPA